MKKKDFDIIKKRKFKRYKSFYRLTKQTGDPYDHCTNKGANRLSKEEINKHLQQRKSLIKKNIYPTDDKIYDKHAANTHLSAQSSNQYRHSTGRADSLFQMLCFDIDPRILMKLQEFQPVIDFLSTFLPDSFYDYGSSGESLNYYFILCFIALYERVLAFEDNFFFDYTGDRYCYMVNTIIDILSTAFQFILMKNFPYLFLENIYPGISEYDYYIDCKKVKRLNKKTGEIKEYTTHKTVYQRLTKNAHMMKLPHPKDSRQEKKLRNMPVLDPVDIIVNIYSYLDFLSSSTFFSDDEQRLYIYLSSIFSVLIKKEPLSLETLSLAHEQISSLRSEIVRGFKKEEIISCTTSNKGNKSSSGKGIRLLYTYMSAQSPVDYYSIKEKEIIETIKNEGDAYYRSVLFLNYLCWKTYTKEQRTPTEQEYIDNYRLLVGTGDEDAGDRKRLKYIYRKRIGKFDPNKLKKKLPYIKNEYIHMLKQEITPEEIITVRNDRSSYIRPVTYEDLDACAGWMYFSLTNKKYIELKKFSKKELTVPAASFHKWYNTLHEKGVFYNKCYEGKSKACREILLHLGWIEYIDKNYNFLDHISRRYILTEKHPRYKQFEVIFGKDEIEKWKKWRDDRDSEVVMKAV